MSQEGEVQRALDETLQAELIPRNCHLAAGQDGYRKRSVRPIEVTGDMIAYASPDSTYSVVRELIANAERSILIGIYDFTADYVKELLVGALSRGVKVSLMLDIDSKEEQTVFDDLKRYGADCVEAPSCASKYLNWFASSHEKVIVIDEEWVLVQSGNFSPNSIPFNEGDGQVVGRFHPGNRDMGIAIRDAVLCRFFTDILNGDMDAERRAESQPGAAAIPHPLPETELIQAAPSKRPQLTPSRRWSNYGATTILPVLSPDNYMDHIPALLAGAKRSVRIEQQYIRVGQPEVDTLLDALAEARTQASAPFEVKIIVAHPFPGKGMQKELDGIKGLERWGLRLGREVKILNLDYFVHCHNKLIVVDEERVLVSSQNWSGSAVAKNREAGLLVDRPEIAAYYASIFDYDWSVALDDVREPGKRAKVGVGVAEVGAANWVRLSYGDYAEV